ncbi:Rrf2 family transcriptional regulator [Komagataeibacter nataicola]|uniref:Rrf2 family transcriptional regulator n=1 Tax=Komagataeibacter nataicola TaxID=265960 RepID=A0A9N7CNP9_9PROT|nr:Rrf2 family transcriptional regulator [Komagataeibacter nataicola]AQU87874.1 Rrf2 family transcriptional regulator [Komagataeibacter nataicola]PYD66433.1 Rrf2 family transcriptional regulator [Komagataeibacter nataicola]WEQ57419.1 Rrf2 family transcriptional regulator [Komagataeibacter nataicola]GBR26410.1 Rrf2 family transcriptional regulator [Komagataeibacter nataicola NRIC 0616]
MRLTLHTDYALRTLLYMGLHADRRVSIHEIASAYDISENHLVKVIHRLSRLGLIDARRGRGGGLVLAHAPEDIRIGDVVRQTEDDLQLVHCEPTHPDGSCCILSDMCKLRGVLSTALGAFMSVLDSTTLADLLPDHERPHLLSRLPGPAQAQQTQQPLAKSA